MSFTPKMPAKYISRHLTFQKFRNKTTNKLLMTRKEFVQFKKVQNPKVRIVLRVNLSNFPGTKDMLLVYKCLKKRILQ